MTHVPSKLYQYSWNHSCYIQNFSHEFAELELKVLHLKLRTAIPLMPSTWYYFSREATLIVYTEYCLDCDICH